MQTYTILRMTQKCKAIRFIISEQVQAMIYKNMAPFPEFKQYLEISDPTASSLSHNRDTGFLKKKKGANLYGARSWPAKNIKVIDRLANL